MEQPDPSVSNLNQCRSSVSNYEQADPSASSRERRDSSLYDRAQRDLSVSNCDDSKLCDMTYVDSIQKLRDIYKEGTGRIFDQTKARLEQESAQRKQEAEKAVALLGHCRQTLQQLDEQHKVIGGILKEKAEQGRSLFEALSEQIRQEAQKSALNASAMQQIIDELRNKNL